MAYIQPGGAFDVTVTIVHRSVLTAENLIKFKVQRFKIFHWYHSSNVI